MENAINYWYQKYMNEKLTWEDIYNITRIYIEMLREKEWQKEEPEAICKEILRRFNEMKKK